MWLVTLLVLSMPPQSKTCRDLREQLTSFMSGSDDFTYEDMEAARWRGVYGYVCRDSFQTKESAPLCSSYEKNCL